MDELPEFPRKVLEVLREPLETGGILISRAACQMEYPAQFQLIAAMNPCPCGFAGDPSGKCRCTPDQVRRYQQKLSGPLLDRIDLFVNVAALPPETLLQADQLPSEPSETVAARVQQALTLQVARQGCRNSQIPAARLDELCDLDNDARAVLTQAANRFGLSARACHRILKVARTLADLKGDAQVRNTHILGALSFRDGLAGASRAASS